MEEVFETMLIEDGKKIGSRAYTGWRQAHRLSYYEDDSIGAYMPASDATPVALRYKKRISESSVKRCLKMKYCNPIVGVITM